MSGEYVSQREFARRVGVSHVWVNRQVKAGNIPYHQKKGIPYEAGLVAYEAAKDVRHEGSRQYHAKQREKRARGEIPKTQSDTKKKSEADDLMTGVNSARVNEKLNEARMVKMRYEARMKQLEYERLSGRLIPVEDVRADAARIGIIVQQRLLSLGGRVANRCEGLHAGEIEEVIRKEVNTIIEELHRSAFAEEEGEGEEEAQ